MSYKEQYKDYYPSKNGSKKNKKRRFSIKPRFLIFVALVLAVIITPIVLLIGGGTYTIGYGAYDTTGSGFDALVIHDELCYMDAPVGKVVYSVVEGQNVATDQIIMDTYAAGYIDQIENELQSVRAKIIDRQNESLLGKIVDTQLTAMDSAIAAQIQNLVDIIDGNTANIAQTELELSSIMTTRQDYLKNSSVAQADTELMTLYGDEEQLVGRLEAWRTRYKAVQDGRISFFFDGMESVLTKDNLVSLTAADVKRIVAGDEVQVDAETKSKQALYRLVDTENWYLAFSTTAREWTAGVGKSVLINIDGYSYLNADAYVESAQSFDNDMLVVLRVSKDVGSLINKRFAHISVGERTEGLMVPLSAVKTRDGQGGVYLADKTFVGVNVVIDDGKSAIVEPLEKDAIVKGSVIRK